MYSEVLRFSLSMNAESRCTLGASWLWMCMEGFVFPLQYSESIFKGRLGGRTRRLLLHRSERQWPVGRHCSLLLARHDTLPNQLRRAAPWTFSGSLSSLLPPSLFD